MKGETIALVLVALGVAAAGVYFFVIRPKQALQPGMVGYVDPSNPNGATADGTSGYAAPVYSGKVALDPTAQRIATDFAVTDSKGNIVPGGNKTASRNAIAAGFGLTLGGKTPTALPPTTNVVNVAPKQDTAALVSSVTDSILAAAKASGAANSAAAASSAGDYAAAQHYAATQAAAKLKALSVPLSTRTASTPVVWGSSSGSLTLRK